MIKGKRILLYSTIVVVLLFFFGIFLVKAQAVLIPFTTAVLLSLLVLPLSQKMESHSFRRGIASLFNTLLLLFISLIFLITISFQLKNITNDWDDIKKTLEPKIEELREYVMEHSPIGTQSMEINDKAIPLLGEKTGAAEKEEAIVFLKTALGFLTDYLITLIYIFFILTYRRHFKEFLLRLFPEGKKDEIKKIIKRSATVTQQYLIGKIVLIAILAALYSVGLGFSGVENFIIISILAATLSIIPYLGNIIGFGIAITYGFITSGETAMLLGIILTFSVAQFVESYILEPYIVGDRVDLHPFFCHSCSCVG